MKGSGMPVIGVMPIVMPTFSKIWNTSMSVLQPMIDAGDIVIKSGQMGMDADDDISDEDAEESSDESSDDADETADESSEDTDETAEEISELTEEIALDTSGVLTLTLALALTLTSCA